VTAAFKLAWLLEQAFLRRLTGVRLKDESDNPALHGNPGEYWRYSCAPTPAAADAAAR
jgi:hypothetical protein